MFSADAKKLHAEESLEFLVWPTHVLTYTHNTIELTLTLIARTLLIACHADFFKFSFTLYG